MDFQQIALVFGFGSAPDEIKDLAVKCKKAYLRQQKAESQCDMWKVEMADSKQAAEAIFKQFSLVLEKWIASQKGQMEALK